MKTMEGFLLAQGKNVYFIESDKENKCKSVIDSFINGLCDLRNLSEELRNRCLNDVNCRNDIASRINKCHYELRGEGEWEYHFFKEKYCIMSFPLNDSAEVFFL